MTNDLLNASIAAALVQANISFSSVIGKSGSEDGGHPVRIFDVPYGLRNQPSTRYRVRGYAAGPLFTALSPIRVTATDIQTARHRMGDVVQTTMPLVRLLPHPYQDQHASSVIWVECSIPLPPNGEPVEPWLVIAPFVSVGGAVELIVAQFESEAAVAPDVAVPIFASQREEADGDRKDPDSLTPAPAASDSKEPGSAR